MADPAVRILGHVWDIDGRALQVGVDYDTITIGGHRIGLAAWTELTTLGAAAEAAALAKRTELQEST